MSVRQPIWQRFTEALVQECPEPILLFDSSFQIIFINEGVSQILNKPHKQIIGSSVHTIFPGFLDSLPVSGKMTVYPDKSVCKSYTIKCQQLFTPDEQLAGGILKFIPNTFPSKNLINPDPDLNETFQADDINQSRREVGQINEKLNAEALFEPLRQVDVQQSLLAGMIENIEDGIIVFDKFARILIWNKGMERDLGLKRNNVLGKSLFDLFPNAKKKAQGQGIMQVLAGKTFALNRISYLSRPGYFNATFSPIKNINQEVVGGIAIVRDITEYLEWQNEQVSRKQSLQLNSMLAVWLTQIEERKRIAEKIHNSLGQLLYGFKMEFMQKAITQDPEKKQYLAALLDETLAETKTIAFELMPAMLEDFGLEATLEEMVNKYSKFSLKLTYYVNGLTERLDRKLEIMIYTVIQELTNNIIKHAKASKARIYLEVENKMVCIKIIDNGIGFEKGKLVYAPKSTGLRNIKNSLKLFNGEIKISSQVGKGTLITVEIPVA